MSTFTWLYPRLPTSTALQIIAARSGAAPADLYDDAALSHPDAQPSATGGYPVDMPKLQEIQGHLRSAAKEAGFPNPLAAKAQEFDRKCGTVLFESMGIVPADAAEDGVWSFLTLIVVPEIGPWRFPSVAEERLLGRPRNVLRRTWWRAWALGPDLTWAPEGCEPLGEDEYVQIMERPSIAGNRRTSRALMEALWRAELRGLQVPRSELMRQMTRRVRALKSHVLLDALPDANLAALLDGVVDESVSAILR